MCHHSYCVTCMGLKGKRVFQFNAQIVKMVNILYFGTTHEFIIFHTMFKYIPLDLAYTTTTTYKREA